MKSPLSSWSFLRDSAQLRSTIAYKLQSKDLFITDAATAIGVAPDRISKYLRGVTPSLTNWQIVKLANYLGMDIELSIKIRD